MGQYPGDQALAQAKIVADASIIAKWFLTEEHSDKSLQLRDAFAKGKVIIAAPSLIFYETLNTLRYSGVYDKDELGGVAESLSKYGFEVWEPKGRLLKDTVRVSIEHDLTVYDATYVVLVIALKGQLYTADSELVEKFPDNVRHIRDFGPA